MGESSRPAPLPARDPPRRHFSAAAASERPPPEARRSQIINEYTSSPSSSAPSKARLPDLGRVSDWALHGQDTSRAPPLRRSSTVGYGPRRPSHKEQQPGTEAPLDADQPPRSLPRRPAQPSVTAAQVKPASKSGEASFFYCKICLDRHPAGSGTLVPSCNHRFCGSCLKNYVVSQLEENRYPAVCPVCSVDMSEKRPGRITDDIVDRIGLSAKEHEAWAELALAQVSTEISCPKCKTMFRVDRADYDKQTIITCPLRGCGGSWCKVCAQITSPFDLHSCSGADTGVLERMMAVRDWKRCPGCSIMVEKIGGCDHMTCPGRGCNTHFCWSCGSIIIRSVVRAGILSAVDAHFLRCSSRN
ncbi:hypothetical protein BOTBODRAFT_121686 [Botryobasidium botryosum FD-172 SS1]|uniref:RING-type domain-containing protein n=1 Tax=Botryobasidium botryosum (strain FD-172 SS1) TaxID=930990 RepID=A0A067LTB8_BOTB1|nr:hypothetical protein BOTBODRAFT_121686 [Botryobasidium botryosum FD-172 SS1]